MGRVLMYPDQSWSPFAAHRRDHRALHHHHRLHHRLDAPAVLKRFGVDPATSSTPVHREPGRHLGVIIYAHVAMLVMNKIISEHLHAAAAP